MHVLYNNGLKSRLWRIVRKLNQNLSAKVKTKYGLTEAFPITNSIRQGGVLAVTQFAILMDEISKVVQERNLGIKLPNVTEKIGCLLWVDDVVF